MTDATATTATTIETRKRMFDAAVIAGDYQNAWKNYMGEQNHHNAREVISLGEILLEKQYETGLSMQSPTYIRHRVLIAQDYLDKNPEKETDKLAQLRSDLVEYGKRTGKI
jgi:hypothetical protein